MFQPSKYSFPGHATMIVNADDDGYGALGLSKRERRDKHIRKAEKYEDKAKKALAKGKKDKAERYLKKAAEHWDKAEKLAGKLGEKGKTTTFTTEETAKRQLQFRSAKARAAGARLRAAKTASDLQAVEQEIEGETMDYVEPETASGLGTALKVGGLAVLGGGLYYYFTMR